MVLRSGTGGTFCSSRDVSASPGEAIMSVLVRLLWREHEEDLLLFRLQHVYSSIFRLKRLIWPQQGDGLQEEGT